ncbi:hypothetical protein IP90_00425 [Luteimonas cucumeris]|uniref:Uncharacterized protein n=1 Tax=Luteimonas cucumeris TaxID=985012 RepID=A0A562LEX6_9GAMM|nr:hypothetical protein [Luteimonas cucumeris]TWI06161.1 hypothetical protein IP90_00425 [Luteimonas cucumeris]
MKHLSTRTLLCGAIFSVALLFPVSVLAGPPLLCHPFDTAGAPSLEWGGKGWNEARGDYDLGQLVARTDALLTARTPIVARMETLRRAAIYASRDGQVARDLAASLDARIAKAGTPDARALALFDAGYYAETLQDIVRLQGYDMPGIGKVDAPALRAIVAKGDGSVRIAQALQLRPTDPGMNFAAALVASADERKADVAVHARSARAGADRDRLVALNLDQIAR